MNILLDLRNILNENIIGFNEILFIFELDL
jgi:hypothetical protein